MNKVMAFWSYDIFPYNLCGEVLEFLPKGYVKVKGYDGMSFKPNLILPYEDGLKLKEELHTLEIDCRFEIKKVKDSFNSKLEDILKEYK